MNHPRQRLIDQRQAAREGRRYAAFYHGARDRRAGVSQNPYPPDTEDARHWEAGWKYMEVEHGPE